MVTPPPRDEKRTQPEVVERHAQARKLVSLLERRRFDPQLGMERVQIVQEREQEVVCTLFKLCGQEVFEAIAPDATGRVFCNLWLIADIAAGKFRLAGNISIVHAGISRAVRAALKRKDRSVACLVKSEVVSELAQRRDEKIAVFRELPAGEILPLLLVGLRSGLHENMAVHMDHLTSDQRSDLKVLLHDQLSDKSVIHIRMNQEPDEPRMWLYWYLYHSEFALPENKRKLGGIPKDLLAIRRGAVRANKRGGIIMPLGPMYAKVFEKQKSELNRLRRRPKNPGVNKIAESLGVSHDTATRWLKENVPVKLEPDGNGGVHYTFNLDTIQRCIEITAGKKRGLHAVLLARRVCHVDTLRAILFAQRRAKLNRIKLVKLQN